MNTDLVQPASVLYSATKRLVDLFAALLLVIILLPALLLIGITVRMSSPGPILFRQARVGKDGRTFTLYKFRSMRADADPHVHEEAVARYFDGECIATGNSKAPYKLVHDSRITPFGSLLRKTSLDELPQLFNVIRGDMAIVGPRPALGYEVARYSDRELLRLAVPQGMTGLWQVKGRGRMGCREALALDLEYVRRRSLWLDLQIVLLTIPTVVLRCGAA